MSIPEAQFAIRVRLMQIITGAMIGGVLMFAVIIVGMVLQRGGGFVMPRGPEDLPIISIIALVVLAACLLARMVVSTTILRSSLRQIAASAPDVGAAGRSSEALGMEQGALLAVRQSTLIVGNALVEGPAFFAGIAYFLEGQTFALIGVLIPVLAMLWQFPTRQGIRSWVDRQLGLIIDIRQLGGL
jgi:hypothetical protein